MGASQFVGRVGGLAVALGVGVAVFSGAGVASADRGDGAPSDTRSSGSAAAERGSSHAGAQRKARPARTPSAAASTVGAQKNTSRPPAPAAANDAPVSLPAAAVVADPEPVVEPAAVVVADPEPVVAPAAGGSAPVAVVEEVVPDSGPGPVESAPVEPVVIVDPVADEPEAAVPGEVSDVVVSATGGPADGAGSGPVGPVDSSLADLLLASFIRRETVGAAATGAVTASATSGLTFAPVTVYFDGVLQGNLNVDSASGCGELGSDCKLEFKVVGSSDGGKANLNNVPDGLPGGGPKIEGVNGSYTFLPYATWIDPDNPTNFPTPTGTQSFTVRVSENTKFDQFLSGIPLVGGLNAKVIALMQQTPFIGNLLAPLIGASADAEVMVNVGQLVTAGKQVAYTYMVESFDGVMISTNYFPASEPSLLPLLGNQQATIFNGPGLGSPGATDPYALLGNAGGAAPPIGLIRGQGLPGPLAQAPLGFNVVTWDPRGEWDSGGILQLDNPFYEGRDVSSLIDWALANTPLLSEGGKPDIAMLGGSYGGGIQMTTVDPRIKAIVPSIAWHSLNESLYPDNVFKTGWANVLAGALLLPNSSGEAASALNRVNSQITQALITGNLFGFISETAQAVLSSSGPTSLLTKLNIPTMYTQGTVDALFPLQQAIENAQTQLEQNPFFAGANADLVKMLWFCGGHGVCTTQTEDQQKAQATVMFLEDMVWVNNYTKDYLQAIPQIKPVLDLFIGLTAAFQWWDQNGVALASFNSPTCGNIGVPCGGMPWTSEFQDTPPIEVTNALGGRINSFTSRTGPLSIGDPAAEKGCADLGDSVCNTITSWPLRNVFATEAKNAVNVDITVPATTDEDNPSVVVGAPLVSFTYKGSGNAKAIYAQIVDNATGQVLGNINTPIPVILDGKEHPIDAFPIANIAYTAPTTGDGTLTLQLVANSSLFANNAVIWSVDISDISVSLPTTSTAVSNPIPALIPS